VMVFMDEAMIDVRDKNGRAVPVPRGDGNRIFRKLFGMQGKDMYEVFSPEIRADPLFKAFKAKSFTDNDITLHFYIMDILEGAEGLTLREIADRITEDYIPHFDGMWEFDESTLRKKLREYVNIGIVCAEKRRRELVYSKFQDNVDLSEFADAVDFASEQMPVGVIGSFLADRLPKKSGLMRFKHHYMLNTLDSQIMHSLLLAISERRMVTITSRSRKYGDEKQFSVYPAKIYISTQTGRQYLMCFKVAHEFRVHPIFFRLDTISSVFIGDVYEKHEYFDNYAELSRKHLWGVSTGDGTLDHIEMVLRVGAGEEYIVQRLEREKRCGTVERTSVNTYTFSADVFDAEEMLPWIRTFTGRIVSLKSSNPAVARKFNDDLNAMLLIYGGDDNDVS